MEVDASSADSIQKADAVSPGPLRNAQMQVVVMGLVFFCIPGAFNSIIGLHSGIPEKYTNAGYGILYFLFAIFSIVAPGIVNIYGPRLMIFVGGCAFVIFFLSLLLCGPLHVLPLPLVTVFAALVGVGAAFLWSANAAMLLSYPTESTKASYISTFWVIFNFGAVIGGIQSFLTNLDASAANSDEDAAAPMTFMIYIALGIVGISAVWALLPLEQVVRVDGSRCQAPKAVSLMEELRGFFKMMSSRQVAALLPLFVYSNWFYSYQLGVFSTHVFKPAASGLASAFYWGSQMIGAKTLGALLDMPGIPAGRRAWLSLGISCSLIAVSWVWGIYANSSYNLDSVEVSKGGMRTLYEYNEPGFAQAAALMLLWGFCDALVQTWCYWVMTQLYTEAEDFARIAGIFKFAQSAGSAASFLISFGNPSASVQLAINIVLFAASLPGAACLCKHVSDASQGTKQTDMPEVRV